MAQITYTNKVALNENPEIADINKVTDDDMNEIKSVVNDNYNNTIQITSTQPTDSDNKIWIDTSSLSQSDNTNMKYNDNGEYKDIYVKAFDTLPVGAIVEFDGSTIPDGWTDIGNNQIKKTSQYIEGGASLSNVYGTSQNDGYSQNYINNNVGVVESGSNANGSYIKYADGTMICYNTKQFTNIPINAAYGALYESASINLDNFPVAFIDIPIVTTSINKGTTVWVEALPNLSATGLGHTWFMKPTSSTGANFWFSYIAIGKWK